MHGQGVSSVAVAALLLVVLGLIVEPMFEKIKLVMVGIVGNGHEVFEYFGNAFLHKRIVTRLLNFDKVGNVDNFVYLTELSSLCFAILVKR